jgi:hypothetical protein
MCVKSTPPHPGEIGGLTLQQRNEWVAKAEAGASKLRAIANANKDTK